MLKRLELFRVIWELNKLNSQSWT